MRSRDDTDVLYAAGATSEAEKVSSLTFKTAERVFEAMYRGYRDSEGHPQNYSIPLRAFI